MNFHGKRINRVLKCIKAMRGRIQRIKPGRYVCRHAGGVPKITVGDIVRKAYGKTGFSGLSNEISSP